LLVAVIFFQKKAISDSFMLTICKYFVREKIDPTGAPLNCRNLGPIRYILGVQYPGGGKEVFWKPEFEDDHVLNLPGRSPCLVDCQDPWPHCPWMGNPEGPPEGGTFDFVKILHHPQVFQGTMEVEEESLPLTALPSHGGSPFLRKEPGRF
jgi:hypothetical protein